VGHQDTICQIKYKLLHMIRSNLIGSWSTVAIGANLHRVLAPKLCAAGGSDISRLESARIM